MAKKKFIEKADLALEPLIQLPDDTLLVITADHSTPCEFMSHSADPVPILFKSNNVRRDDIQVFNERSCCKGGLGYIIADDIMPQIHNLFDMIHLTGA